MDNSNSNGKAMAGVSDEELDALVKQNAQLQVNEQSGDGIKADYVLLAKDGTKALKRSQKDLYIEGLQMGDFFIQKDKVVLGASIDVVPLAFVVLYQEKDGAGRDSNFFGNWNREQALTYPLVEGSFYNRQLPNGHILCPVNWAMVEVLGHPELENAVMTFKSTGTRIWKAWKEDAKSRSASSATLVYTMSEKVYSNADYEWTDFGFAYKGSILESDRAQAVHCLKKSNGIREAYEKSLLIGNRTVESGAKLAIAQDKAGVEDSFDDEEQGF